MTAPEPAAPPGRWHVVMPVKGGRSAKTRLTPMTAAFPHLATALASDALDAVLASPRVAGVWVVSTEPAVAALATGRGAVAVEESHPGAGLLAAIADGLRACSAGDGAHPTGRTLPVAVLLADVPCLLPADVDAALAEAAAALAAGAPSVLVPDAEGTGTVLLAAARADALPTRFGAGSSAAHRAAGAVVVGSSLARLRRDVDTPAELTQALALGVGPATLRAMGRSRSRAS